MKSKIMIDLFCLTDKDSDAGIEASRQIGGTDSENRPGRKAWKKESLHAESAEPSCCLEQYWRGLALVPKGHSQTMQEVLRMRPFRKLTIYRSKFDQKTRIGSETPEMRQPAC